jgi:hypothetical protein
MEAEDSRLKNPVPLNSAHFRPLLIRHRGLTSFLSVGRFTWLARLVPSSLPSAILENVSGRKIALLTGFGQKIEVIEKKTLNPV